MATPLHWCPFVGAGSFCYWSEKTLDGCGTQGVPLRCLGACRGKLLWALEEAPVLWGTSLMDATKLVRSLRLGCLAGAGAAERGHVEYRVISCFLPWPKVSSHSALSLWL